MRPRHDHTRHAAQYQRQFGFAALYSSDLRRAMEMAHIIATEMGLEHLRDMAPENGAWSKVVLEGALT